MEFQVCPLLYVDLNPVLDLIPQWKKNMELGKRRFYMEYVYMYINVGIGCLGTCVCVCVCVCVRACVHVYWL